jgi:DNA-binding winged helix-turn-helix (wHTH) protein
MGVWYEFGEFRLDPERRLVWNGDGAPLELAPRAFDALLMMISRPGELIEKAALMGALWPNVTVVENSLDQIVSRLRRALGDTSKDSPLIVTERGRGYRFVASVRVLSTPDETTEASREPLAPNARLRRGSTRDRDAQRLYQQGRALSTRPSPDNLRAACELFRAAYERDPNFYLALAHLALMRPVLVMFGLAEPSVLDIAMREARTALGAVSDLGRAYQALGNIAVLRGKWNEAKENFDAAVRFEEDPDARVTRIWQVTLAVGHLRLGLDQALGVDALIPAQPLGAVAATIACSLLGLDEEAARYADAAEALGWPRDQDVLKDTRSSVALRAGRFGEAREIMTSSLGASMLEAGGASTVELFCSAMESSALRGSAIDSLRAVVGKIPEAKLGLPDRQRLMPWFTMLGALDDAFALTSGTLDILAKRGIVGLRWGVLWIPEMLPFRRDPRFRDIVARIGFMDYWERHGPPDGYALEGRGPDRHIVEVSG